MAWSPPFPVVKLPDCQQNWESVKREIGLSAFSPGDLKPSAVSEAPNGWLLCDGSAVSRTDYADLFAAIGTAYGTGDGSTTFNVPDLQGRVPVGAGDGASTTSRALGDTGGAETHTLSTSEIPSHSHGFLGGTSTWSSLVVGLSSGGGQTTLPVSPQTSTASAGGGGSHNNMQPYAVVNWLIKT